MPAGHDLDPDWMTEDQRLEKRRYQAYHAFEMEPPMTKRSELLHPDQFGEGG